MPLYAEKFFDELDGKPFDREVLDRFGASVKGRGRCAISAAAPGRSRAIWRAAASTRSASTRRCRWSRRRRLNPTLDFRQGDFFALPLDDSALAGVAAFYCLIHCARE